MKKNMGATDRLIRVIVAVVICFLYLFKIITGAEGGLLLLLAVAFAFTSLLGTSPIYLLLGFRTNKEVQDD